VFSAPQLLLAGHMGLSPVAYFICILSSNVLAVIAVWGTTKGGSVEYPSGEWRVTRGGTGIPEDEPENFLCILLLSSLYHRIHAHGSRLHIATELLKVMIDCTI